MYIGECRQFNVLNFVIFFLGFMLKFFKVTYIILK